MTDGLMRRTWEDFRFHWRQSLGFHFVLQLLGVAILTPLIAGVGRLLVRASGGPVISNYDLVAFGLSPVGIAFVLVVAALTVTLLLAEFAGQNWIAGHAVARRPVTVSSTIAFLVRKLPWLSLLSARVFLRLVLLALPFLAGAALVWFTMLRGHDINFYLAEHPPEWRRAKVLAVVLGAGYALVVIWQLARWLFAIPILTYKGVRPGQALRDSMQMTRGHLGRIVPPLVLWWLLVSAAALAIAWGARSHLRCGARLGRHRCAPGAAAGGALRDDGGRGQLPVQRGAPGRAAVPGDADVRGTAGCGEVAGSGDARDR